MAQKKESGEFVMDKEFMDKLFEGATKAVHKRKESDANRKHLIPGLLASVLKDLTAWLKLRARIDEKMNQVAEILGIDHEKVKNMIERGDM